MRSLRIAAIGALGALAMVFCAGATYVATSNYMASGSDWEIGSGGTLNIKTGGVFSFNGVQQNGPTITGEAALSGTNPTSVVTGLNTVTGCTFAIKESTAPGVSTTALTYTSSGGTLSVYAWKPTNSSTTTLIASTGTETFGWSCSGT